MLRDCLFIDAIHWLCIVSYFVGYSVVVRS